MHMDACYCMMLFALSFMSGILLSYKINRIMQDVQTVMLAANIMIIGCISKQFFPSSSLTFLLLFMTSVVGNGILFNSSFIIMSCRIKPELMSLAIELFFCMAMIASQLSPFMASKAEPVPMSYICTNSMLVIVVMLLMPTPNKENELNENLSVIIEAYSQYFEGSQANIQSIMRSFSST